MSKKIITGFITVRTSSTRLPAKCLLPFGDGNVLEHVIRRARAFGIEPIVCTSFDKSDDVIQEIAIKANVKYFRGSLKNKLKRWLDCAEYFGVTAFHTIDADDPFFDGDEMRCSMSLLLEGLLDMVCPSLVSSDGAGSVGYSLTTDIVKRGVADLLDDVDTEMMWFYLEKIPGLRSTVLPNNPFTPPNIRLTLDYEQDYWLLESIRRILGGLAPRSEIDQLFKSNPDLYKINWFHNAEWKASQLSKKI
jgi:spore coat polysaccharide biosynthesis protein SpsF (cytidylyltransferase family)